MRFRKSAEGEYEILLKIYEKRINTSITKRIKCVDRKKERIEEIYIINE
jgi:hypothetical protein